MDRNFIRNTAGVCSVEFLWGLGIPVVIESTFLQLFLRNLGATSLLVGLIPTLLSLGLALVAPLSGALTAPLSRKRPAVVVTHVAASLPLLGLGLYLWLAGITASALGVFFAAYALFSFGVGMLWPVWQNYLVRIFVPAKAVAALAVMSSCQSAAKLISSFVILKLVERYSFSARGAALIFTLVGLTCVAGSLMFLATREPESEPNPGGFQGLARGLVASAREVTADRNFLRFLGSDLEYYSLSTVLAFYANYATEYCGVSAPAASGLFVALNYVGGITANALLGWLGLLSLRNKLLLTKLLSLAAIPLLCFSRSLPSFLIVSFCFGASRGTRMAVFAPAVKQLSGKDDATHYFAIAPLLQLPLSAGIPLAAGGIIDGLEALGSWSYRAVFLGAGVLILAAVIILFRVRFPAGGRSRRWVGRGGAPQAVNRTRRG